MKSISKYLTGLGFYFCALPWAAAQTFSPDILMLDGANGLSFPAHESLTLTRGNTIEFWTMPNWDTDPNYDPVILSNAGPDGPLYMISLLREKNGLGISSGSQDEFAPFDFNDGAMHHVAIANLNNAIMVMVDGTVIGNFAMTFSDLPSSGFWIGTADGQASPFQGAIANLRLWDVAVAPEDLVKYAQANLSSADHAHPDAGELIGYSNFEAGGFVLTDLGTSEEITP